MVVKVLSHLPTKVRSTLLALHGSPNDLNLLGLAIQADYWSVRYVSRVL